MNREIRSARVEAAEASEELSELFDALSQRRAVIDERVVRAIGRQIGFHSSDENVYRLLAALTEQRVETALQSLNHRKAVALSEIHRRIEAAKRDAKTTPKRVHNLLRVLMAKRVLTLHETLTELREFRPFISKIAEIPRSDFASKI